MVLGKVTQVTPSMVEGEAVENLQRIVQKPAEGFLFDCSKCGAERRNNIIDPGVMRFKGLNCSAVGLVCERPKLRSIPFVPGSLVMAPIDPETPTIWPGIIEPCPDWPELTDGHFISERGEPNIARAYYVTFIFPEDPEDGSRKFYGGFIEARVIRAFPENRKSRPTGGRFDGHELSKSVELAADATSLSLAERLLKFSVVAHAANLRKINLTQERTEIDDSEPGSSGYAHRGRKRKEPSQELFEPESRNQERALRARTALDETEEPTD